MAVRLTSIPPYLHQCDQSVLMTKTAMRHSIYRYTIVLAASVTLTMTAADLPVTVSVDSKTSKGIISPEFTGLSFESALLLPGENGVRYFRPDNQPLINLFRQLGIKNLRIGGNTSDRDAKQLPDEPDFDSLFTFAKAADVKVI